MKQAYSVTVTRDGKWWMVSIPSVRGLTQARRLSEAETMAKEFISANEDIPIEDVEVELRVRVGGIEIDEQIRKIHADRRAAIMLERKATEEAEELARSLSAQGVPLRDIGAALGVSHQRAHQLVSA